MLNTQKNVRTFSARRLVALFCCMAIVLAVFSVRLFQVQIVDGDEYASLADASTQTTISIAASRGEIVDKNQIPLVSNRTSYAVTLDYNYFPHGSSEEKRKEQNDYLVRLMDLFVAQGEEWNDTFPVSQSVPYTFLPDREDSVARMKKGLNMASYATADNCVNCLVEKYTLSGYTPEQQRYLAGVHYEMETAGFGASVPYTFAGDIGSETMFKLVESSDRFPGLYIETVPVREYVSGRIACHVIGTIGPIYAEQYDELKDKGYSYNDILGKSGIEAAAEGYLRGTKGKRILVKNSGGTVISEERTVDPIPGKTVILSLDSQLQKKAQDVLDSKIKSMRATAKKEKGRDIKSGAVVMLDVHTGGVIVSASWPDFDLTTYNDNYNSLIQDPDNPFFNRALCGAFPCGSTFKPGVALAAITDGIISGNTQICCTRKYMYYAPSYTPSCMGRHGYLTPVTAIQKSCNYYFYEVGRLMGRNIFSYLTLYGFGQKTGVEVDESAGRQPTPESLQATGDTWVAGDYLQLAIGQRGAYTPIQLAAYVMMIANQGVRYKTHFISAVRSYDSVSDTPIEPEIAASVKWSSEAIDTVRKGMVAVGKAGTASAYFSSRPYTVACKTGTAQTGIAHTSDHGTFIAYAPVNDPEVAIAVVMENGTSGASTYVGRQLLDAYFSNQETGEAPTAIGTLVP